MKQPPSFKNITEVTYINGRLLFPISWLHKQEFCEYQIYLENIRGIKVKPTRAMVQGKDEHELLYDKFAEKAVPATIEDMLTESKITKVLSREFKVMDIKHGIFGYIDEVWLTPDSFVVIDDKPGLKTYPSNIHQIYGYCLAFKTIIEEGDNRQVVAALGERGTQNIYWQATFDQSAEEEIQFIIYHIHALLSGSAHFVPADNPNKCKFCRMNNYCDRAAR